MSQAGRNLRNDPSNNGVMAFVGDVLGDSSNPAGYHKVVKSHILMVPIGGSARGYSDDNVHWSNGYAATGDGPAYCGSISGRADGTR